MKKMNHILNKKFVIYAKKKEEKKSALIIKKLEIIAIILENIEVLLIMPAILIIKS